MRKPIIFILFVISSPIIAGIYGIFVDELSYNLYPEFFTRFRFVQFGFEDSAGAKEAAIIGWNNSWLIGILIGIPIAVAGLIHKETDKMVKYNIRAYLIALTTTISASVIGFLSGKYILTEDVVRWNLPEKIHDTQIFVALETMNNFSYMGGTTGMLLAILYLIKQKKKDESVFSPSL